MSIYIVNICLFLDNIINIFLILRNLKPIILYAIPTLIFYNAFIDELHKTNLFALN